MGRRKKDNRTPEEIDAQYRASELKKLQDELYLIPEPTYQFNIGDSVDIGALLDVIVINKFDGNKIYEIEYGSLNQEKVVVRNRRFVHWLDIRKPNLNKSIYVPDELELRYTQRTLSDLLIKVYKFGVNFNPEYQRDYVWELADKVALIDSIFHDIDIGKFVFIDTEKYDYGYEILDGKQRLRAICDFYEDKFMYKDMFFSNLGKGDQNHFEEYTISEAEVRRVTRQQIYKYFVRLNTAGKIMSKDQIDKVRALITK